MAEQILSTWHPCSRSTIEEIEQNGFVRYRGFFNGISVGVFNELRTVRAQLTIRRRRFAAPSESKGDDHGR